MTVLGKVQIGKESPLAHGTPVAATKIWPMQQKPLPADSKPTAVQEDLGSRAGTTNVYTMGKLVEDTLTFNELPFQAMPYILSGLLKGGVTPEETTVDQDDWIWEHGPYMDGTDNELDSFTLERGDTVQAVEQEYVMFKRLKLSGVVDQSGAASPVKGELDYFARQNTNTVFTPNLSPFATNFMNSKLTQLWVDSLLENIGTTEMTNFLRAWDLEILGGAHPIFNGSTDETFNSHDQGDISFMLALTVQRGAASEALRAAQGQTKAMRLKVNGPRIGTGVYHMLDFELYGYIEDFVVMAEKSGGGKLDTFMFHGMREPLSGSMIYSSVTTNVASL